eukprot:TRINITY_DN3292_c0_g2_i1.p1 TRINITY_DN3292_c0_g2~~TRINITY_DN3292_c0_g2_i1.p1  ORF type:complete len:350 (+),score=50.11 TRINITY_DN3292_c0_g2_i1:102-1151(+)
MPQTPSVGKAGSPMRPMMTRSFSEVSSLQAYSPVIPVIAQMLARECARNEGADVPKEQMALFESDMLSKIHVSDFLIRMCKYERCSPPVFVLMAVYLDRFRAATDIVVTQNNVHKLMLTASMVAAKYHDDHIFTNEHYAGIGCLTVQEINALEAIYLEKIEWSCFVHSKLFEAYKKQLSLQCQPEVPKQPREKSPAPRPNTASQPSHLAPSMVPLPPGSARESANPRGFIGSHGFRPRRPNTRTSDLLAHLTTTGPRPCSAGGLSTGSTERSAPSRSASSSSLNSAARGSGAVGARSCQATTVSPSSHGRPPVPARPASRGGEPARPASRGGEPLRRSPRGVEAPLHAH